MKIKRFLEDNSTVSSRIVPCSRVAWPVAMTIVLCATSARSTNVLMRSCRQWRCGPCQNLLSTFSTRRTTGYQAFRKWAA